MLVNVLEPATREFKPGRAVKVHSDYGESYLLIKRIVETVTGTYVVFSDHTWRPVSTYGKTWWITS